MAKKEIALPSIERVAARSPYVEHHATNAIEPSLGCQKNSATTSPQTSGHLIPWIAVSLIIMCRAWLSKRPTRLRAAPNMNRRQRKQQHLQI